MINIKKQESMFLVTYPTSSLKRAASVGGTWSVAVGGGAGAGGTSTVAPPQPAIHISSRQVTSPPSLMSCNARIASSESSRGKKRQRKKKKTGFFH